MAENIKNPLAAAKKWLDTLMGKKSQEGQTSQVASGGKQIPQEDSVANDVKMFKEFSRKSTEKIKTLLGPFAKKSATSVSTASGVVGTSLDKKFLKTIIRIFFILFFVLVLVFIAVYLFKMLGDGDGISQNPQVSSTPVPFEPFKPSVYADDPEVLKIEEDVNILERELSQTNIREDGINPPNLDFEISF